MRTMRPLREYRGRRETLPQAARTPMSPCNSFGNRMWRTPGKRNTTPCAGHSSRRMRCRGRGRSRERTSALADVVGCSLRAGPSRPDFVPSGSSHHAYALTSDSAQSFPTAKPIFNHHFFHSCCSLLIVTIPAIGTSAGALAERLCHGVTICHEEKCLESRDRDRFHHLPFLFQSPDGRV